MSVSFKDKTLLCLECGAEFEFSAAQQQEYSARGFTSEPKRCKTCRERRRETAPHPRPPREPRHPPGEHRAVHAPGPRRPVTLHPAVCTACGAETQVPFRPIEGRPVYCRSCHDQRRRDDAPPGRSAD
jgi:CxxC-x17-CxxC domain-containing protein